MEFEWNSLEFAKFVEFVLNSEKSIQRIRGKTYNKQLIFFYYDIIMVLKFIIVKKYFNISHFGKGQMIHFGKFTISCRWSTSPQKLDFHIILKTAVKGNESCELDRRFRTLLLDWWNRACTFDVNHWFIEFLNSDWIGKMRKCQDRQRL